MVSADIIGALLARVLLEKYPGEHVLYDLRSSRAVREEIVKYGGIPVEWKVGHTNVRTKMRECNAILGIELAGHYFFRDTYFSEGGPYPAFLIMELMEFTGRPLSELVAEVKRYHHSGEINSSIKATPETIYEELMVCYPDASISNLDGLKLTEETWWCSLRPSANDPVLRLNVEASDSELMKSKQAEILKIIQKFS